MPLSQVLMVVCYLGLLVAGQSSEPGYFTNFSTMPNNHSISFGNHYAILNLDIISDVTEPISNTQAGKTWLSCLQTWFDAVNMQNPRPLVFWTRIYYENSHYPDVKPGSPLSGYLASLGVVVGPGNGNPDISIQDQQIEASPLTRIWPDFTPNNESDIVLEKTRFYAGFGNNLEHILAAQSIDTVILSGIRTSGVILATAYNLISLNYNVYVISNNTIESPNPLGSDVAQAVDQSIKEGILPNLPSQVITLEQALGALNRSGQAVY